MSVSCLLCTSISCYPRTSEKIMAEGANCCMCDVGSTSLRPAPFGFDIPIRVGRGLVWLALHGVKDLCTILSESYLRVFSLFFLAGAVDPLWRGWDFGRRNGRVEDKAEGLNLLPGNHRFFERLKSGPQFEQRWSLRLSLRWSSSWHV